jgi:hypothetical protein
MQSEFSDVARTLQDRKAEYGDWYQDGGLADKLISLLENEADHWDEIPGFMRQSIRMILVKIARVCSGNPHNKDSWHDMQGYAKLAEERCSERAKPIGSVTRV